MNKQEYHDFEKSQQPAKEHFDKQMKSLLDSMPTIEDQINKLGVGAVSGSTSDEFRKCANCGKDMNMTKKEYKTLMDRGMHRYVCSSECMFEYYR